MFNTRGWNGDTEVIGVHISVPKEENGEVILRVDFGQNEDSQCFNDVLETIETFVSRLPGIDFLLRAHLTKPKRPDVEVFRTLGSVKEDCWVLAIRDSHIVAHLDYSLGREMITLFAMLDPVRSAGKMLLLKKENWPFDTEAHPLKVKIAWKNEMLYTLLYRQMCLLSLDSKFMGRARFDGLPENTILAISYEPAQESPSLVLWLTNRVDSKPRDELVRAQKGLMHFWVLHHEFVLLDRALHAATYSRWSIFKAPRYAETERFAYKLLIRNQRFFDTVNINQIVDYESLPQNLKHDDLMKSRLVYFYMPSPLFLLANQKGTLLAITADCPIGNFSRLASGCDWLVSHANYVYSTLQATPSCIILEPMVDEGGKELLTRFHLVLPFIINLQTKAGQSSIKQLWFIVHLFLRACGIRGDLDQCLRTVEARSMEEGNKWSFSGNEPAVSDEIGLAVTGPTNTEICNAKGFLKLPRLSLEILRERAQGNFDGKGKHPRGQESPIYMTERRLPRVQTTSTTTILSQESKIESKPESKPKSKAKSEQTPKTSSAPVHKSISLSTSKPKTTPPLPPLIVDLSHNVQRQQSVVIQVPKVVPSSPSISAPISLSCDIVATPKAISTPADAPTVSERVSEAPIETNSLSTSGKFSGEQRPHLFKTAEEVRQKMTDRRKKIVKEKTATTLVVAGSITDSIFTQKPADEPSPLTQVKEKKEIVEEIRRELPRRKVLRFKAKSGLSYKEPLIPPQIVHDIEFYI